MNLGMPLKLYYEVRLHMFGKNDLILLVVRIVTKHDLNLQKSSVSTM